MKFLIFFRKRPCTFRGLHDSLSSARIHITMSFFRDQLERTVGPGERAHHFDLYSHLLLHNYALHPMGRNRTSCVSTLLISCIVNKNFANLVTYLISYCVVACFCFVEGTDGRTNRRTDILYKNNDHLLGRGRVGGSIILQYVTVV